MAVTPITLPAKMTIDATDGAKKFVPYKENFVTPVDKGDKLTLVAKTLGQYLYYKKQGFEEGTVAGAMEIFAPATITITNNTAKVMNFIPYRENFSYALEAGAGVSFVSTTAGQTLYYMAQDTNGYGEEGGLDVAQVAFTDEVTVSEPDMG